jgi:integrase/recombinase XerD
VLATIKCLHSFANRVFYLPFNVGAAVELPKVKDTLSERFLTEAEAHRIMNAPECVRDRVLLSVLYAGAFRREEAVRLKWRDLKDRDDLGAGVGQATLFGKGSKFGVVLLPASVYSQVLGLRKVTENTSTGEKIERYAGEAEPVFRSRTRNTGRNGHLEVGQVNRIVTKAVRDADIDRAVSPHLLRHANTGRYLHARPNDSSALHLGP